MARIDIGKLALEHGQENLRFMLALQRPRIYDIGGFCIGATSSDDPYDLVECVVNTEGRYPSIINKEGYTYKISLKAIDESYGGRDYYVCDLESLCDRSTDMRVFVVGQE